MKESPSFTSLTASVRLMFACACFALCCFVAVPIPANARPIITKQSAAVGVTIPLMGRDRSKPAASLRVASFSVGSQSHGFFRIGVLPLLVATDVQIVFSGTNPDASALADLAPAFKALAKTSAVEIHQFALLLSGEATPALTAAQAEPDGNGNWKLTGVTLSRSPSRQVSEALLRTAGADSGRIVFEEAGATQTLSLFP